MKILPYVKSRGGFLFLPAVIAGLFSVNALATDQIRWKNSLSVKVNRSFDFSLSYENRFNELTVFKNHFLSAYYMTATYNISPRWYTALGIRRQDTELISFTINENRIYIQGGRKDRLGEQAALDTRMRIEYRSYKQTFIDDYFRFRIRFKFRIDTKLAGVKISPNASDELFADDRAGARAFLNRNRIFVGIAVPIGTHVGCELSHMFEQNTGFKPAMALALALTLSF
jgi:hypothetical protein